MATRKKLNNAIVHDLAPPVNQPSIRVWDLNVKAMFVRVSRNGTKSFYVRYHLLGKRNDYSIGKFPQWTVAQARKAAQRIISKVAVEHADPLAERKRLRLSAENERQRKRLEASKTLRGYLDTQFEPWAIILKVSTQNLDYFLGGLQTQFFKEPKLG